MKVEFLCNTGIDDGRQLFIKGSEFKKAKNDIEEFNSFAFATHAYFMFYECDTHIERNEYDYILSQMSKDSDVIITAEKHGYRRIAMRVYLSTGNKLKYIDLEEAYNE